MGKVSREQVETVLKSYQDPYLHQDLISAGAVQDLRIEDGQVSISVVMGYPVGGIASELEDSLRKVLSTVEGVEKISITVSHDVIAHVVQKGVKPLRNIKNIIAIASGKGGVGKSTTAVNLALALSMEGARVGILDADIYGPSQPRMLGCQDKPQSLDGKSVEPIVCHGLQSMSIGYLIDDEAPMIWRGPMVSTALQQLLGDTNWQEMDYLVIDLPPGTGDTQLTLAQKIPVSGVVIVTTPQDIALLDARKAVKMFEKVEVPVLGVIENMSTHICTQCGHEEHIFGEGGGQRMAEEYGIELLGTLPLDLAIRRDVDEGNPSVVADPESPIAQSYREIARKLAAKLSLQAKDYSARFPDIVIQNT